MGPHGSRRVATATLLTMRIGHIATLKALILRAAAGGVSKDGCEKTAGRRAFLRILSQR